MVFKDRLSFERKKYNIRQVDLAIALNVSQVSISNWEKGIKEPGYQTLIELCKIFHVSADYMLGIE